MPRNSTNPTSFVPQQYDETWSYNTLVTHYIDLCTEYFTLQHHIQSASLAYPFECERTIHNLVNIRNRLEYENQLLRRQNQELDNANETNHSINKNLKQRYKGTQETLCAVLEEQVDWSEGGEQGYREEVIRLREENKELRKQVEWWTSWGDVNVQDLVRMWDEGEKARKKLEELDKEVKRLNGANRRGSVRDHRMVDDTRHAEEQSVGEEGTDGVEGY